MIIILTENIIPFFGIQVSEIFYPDWWDDIWAGRDKWVTTDPMTYRMHIQVTISCYMVIYDILFDIFSSGTVL